MAREVRRAIRRAFDSGPDPYAELDKPLATRLGGALWLIGVLYAVIVLPIAPPDRAWDWIGIAVCLTAATGAGIMMLRRSEPMRPDTLLGLVFTALGVLLFFRWFAGPSSPFPQMVFLVCLYSAAVHPARRTFAVLGVATVVSLSPLLYEPPSAQLAATTLGHLSLTWLLGMVIVVWTTRMRGLRREVGAAREQAERLARIDPLTGLANPRALDEALPAAVAGARRQDEAFSVLVADLDSFKHVNDAFGHQAGDDLIRAVARALQTAVRLPDPCFRWGGDEFVALLPGASIGEAREIAARVSSTVALSCRRPDGKPQRISVGVAELGPGELAVDVVARADAALLAAKARRPVARAS